jgi:sulfite reductase (NADPH) flavoprotein alpha-component
VLVITSTHGDGDPPETASAFFEDLCGGGAPRLDHLRYAVLGLGDSSFEHFCAAARRLDQPLQELGAQPLVNRGECDVDYEQTAEQWFDELRSALADFRPEKWQWNNSAVSVSTLEADGAPARGPKYSKQRPFPARAIENIRLTDRGSSKAVHHIELSIGGEGMDYLPGDALGVVPANAPELVDEILVALQLTGGESLGSGDTKNTLRHRLLHEYNYHADLPFYRGLGHAERCGGVEGTPAAGWT